MSNTASDDYINTLSVWDEIMYEGELNQILFRDNYGCLLENWTNEKVYVDWTDIEEDYERMKEEAKEDGLKEWWKQYLINNR